MSNKDSMLLRCENIKYTIKNNFVSPHISRDTALLINIKTEDSRGVCICLLFNGAKKKLITTPQSRDTGSFSNSTNDSYKGEVVTSCLHSSYSLVGSFE